MQSSKVEAAAGIRSHRRRGLASRSLALEPLEDRRVLSGVAEFLLDINTTPNSQSSTPQSFTQVGSLTYFIANDGFHGFELWRSDGTEAGTLLVKDVIPGRGRPPRPRSSS
jgi:ELWxxDGT repeat protein